ncbi:MAG: hypothetical protein ACPIOQ_20765 [Promethearchaeia archaeon]
MSAAGGWMAPPTESGPDAEIQDVSGSDDGSSDGGDDGPVGAAVLSVVDTLSALEPEDLDTAMLEIKAQLATVQYMASLNKIAGSVLAYDGNDGCPFPAAHRPALKALFKRASVVQHSVFKVGTTPTLRAAQPRSAGGGRARSRTCR